MQKGLAWKAVAQPPLPMALLAQRHRDWGCLLALPPQTSNVAWRSLPGASSSPAPKVRTCPDSSQPEGASLESCCSASSAHCNASRGTKSPRLCGHLFTSNIKHCIWVSAGCLQSMLPQMCEHLQRAPIQKGLAWIDVAQPHLPMALLAQRHRDWGCLLVLPPQTSNVARGSLPGGLQQPCSKSANVSR